MSTNYDGRKVRYKNDCYILRSVLLVIILLWVITIIWYYQAKHRSKTETHCRANNIKKSEKVRIKNSYYF